jgi:hypothetical protein
MRLGKQGISKHATCEQQNHGCKKCREKSTVHLMRAFTWLTQPELLTLLICFACKGFGGRHARQAQQNCSRDRLLTPRYPNPLLWHQGGPTANDSARSISRKYRCTQLACLSHGKSDVGQRLSRSASTLQIRRSSMIIISAHGDAGAPSAAYRPVPSLFLKPLQDTELLAAIGAARKITRKPRKSTLRI